MKPSKILERVKAELGYPTVNVYTEDATIDMFRDLGLEMLSSKVLREIKMMVPCKNCVKLPKEEVQIVIDCQPYLAANNQQHLIYMRDDFTVAEAVEFFNLNSQGILIPTLAKIEYNQLSYNFNSRYDWKYDRQDGLLYSTNIPSNALSLAVTAKVLYTEETLTQELSTWLYNFTLAKTKVTEGRIRSKFKEGSVGAPSDGEALIAEGSTDLGILADELNSFISLDYGVRS